MAGLSQNPGELIGFRVLQGIGAGGLTALVQVVLADIVSPRERGRYMGYLGAVMAVGTVGGPLLGGLITDSVGWRWNFYIGIPIAALAIVVLQKTLHLPDRRRTGVKVDYVGVALISMSVSLLLIWVTLGGTQFDWASPQTVTDAGRQPGLGALCLVWHESRVAEPIIPLELFHNRTVVLAVIASISVGVAMFGTSVFLSQYMQLARGKTPTESGLLTIPMIAGLLIASTVIGQVISRTGVWKRYVVTGSILLTVGMGLMGTVRYDTNWFELVGLHVRPRRRHRHDHAEPRARRAERPAGADCWGRAARRSRSSAASAAPSASRRWARSSGAASPPSSPTDSAGSASRPARTRARSPT